jgi:5-methylcytosine-specific restriction enzyme subunit McrC
MTGRETIHEYEDFTWSFSDDDLALLQGSLRTAFTVNRSLAGPGYTLNPGSTVGVIRLPSGLQIEIRPKVPMMNLLWMLAAVEDLQGIDFRRLEDDVALDEFDQILEIIADAFTGMVERRLDLGLYRNYVEEEDNLPTVRGRILIAPDVHHNAVLRHRTYCRFTTYSWDLPENQVIRQVVRQLAGWGLTRKLTARLIALDHQMDEISPSRLTAGDVDRFIYNRQSEDYVPIHRYCRFFLNGASLNEEAGDYAFDGFLWNMNALFEAFITAKLRSRMGPGVRLSAQAHHTLDDAGSVVIRPDIVLENAQSAVLIGDTKYKKLSLGNHKHADLYQMLSYCTAMDVRSGVLIYPRHGIDREQHLAIRHSAIRIRETSVDLGGTIEAIEREIDHLAQRLRDWSDHRIPDQRSDTGKRAFA